MDIKRIYWRVDIKIIVGDRRVSNWIYVDRADCDNRRILCQKRADIKGGL